MYVITNNDHPFIRFQRNFLIKILIKKKLNMFFHNKTKYDCCKRGRGNGDYRRVTFDTKPLVCVLRQVNLIIYTDSITEQTIKSDSSKLRESGGNNWHITSAFCICFPVKLVNAAKLSHFKPFRVKLFVFSSIIRYDGWKEVYQQPFFLFYRKHDSNWVIFGNLSL